MTDESQTESTGELSDRIIGDFRLLRRIGVGGMAEVYLAEQLSLKRSVAVKILHKDTVSGKENTLLKRFEQEARAAGGLNHSNIVQVFMTGEQDDLHYIVQEYVQGQNLSQWTKRNGPPNFLTGLKWMKQVAGALKAASESGIVHRDIKPENIMLTRGEDAKVTDFGLAQLNEAGEKMNLTQVGTTMGTPWYMSPEQIQGEQLDHRSDQYSFGVTCYHMFAGQPPFPGKNSVSVAVQHLKEEPAPLSQHRRELPERLCQAIHRMLAKKPEDRFQTPDDLLSELEDMASASLKPGMHDPSTITGWIMKSLPSRQMLLGGLLASIIAGAACASFIFQPVDLVPAADRLVQESSAARQFAQAITSPQSAAKWEAVVDYYPQTEEAYWARVHLGAFHLSRRPAAINEAESQFQKLLEETSFKKDDQVEVRILATIGEALIAHLRGDTEKRDDIMEKRLLQEHPDIDEMDPRGPRDLQLFLDNQLYGQDSRRPVPN